MLFAVLVIAAFSPGSAHTDHKKKQAAAELAARTAAQANANAATSVDPTVAHSQMGEIMEAMNDDRSKMSRGSRLLDWLGRLHPMIVHFPIAFFPAALFTAIVGRRRPAFAAPVQFLVVAGGIIAPVAAVLGWFDGGLNFATDDALLRSHRWLGTAIGIVALVLAISAWRKPEEDRGPAMIVGLAMITAAIVVQGWLGGALVHGTDHMNW